MKNEFSFLQTREVKMAQNIKQSNRILLVFKYLWETTDEDHTASLADISAYLQGCGIPKPDARTLRKDIEQLIEFGVDIVHNRSVQNQYHVATRHFEAPELKLLIDAVQSSRFITQKKSMALIAKLASFAGPYHTELLHRELYVDSRTKSNNESIYLAIDRIQTAVAEKRKISFQYFDYASDKTRVLRHNGRRYAVSPYALIWNNDAYYLVGHHDSRGHIATFRVDRIIARELLNEPVVERPSDFDVSAYFTKEFSMLGGRECEVELLCQNDLMGNILDRFGEDVLTEIVDEGYFKATVTVALSNNFYGWVFASAGSIRILSPSEAISEFQQLLSHYHQ